MVREALKKVFGRAPYVVLALCIALSTFVFAVWLPNLPLIARVLTDADISFVQKLELPLSLLGSITTNFTSLSASYTIAISVLFGMNAAMLVFLLRRRISDVQQSGIATSFLGVTSGALGIGCAACGSFLLTTVLSIFGASGILIFLPLGGAEFGVLGVILLSLSLYLTAKQIQNPAVCKT